MQNPSPSRRSSRLLPHPARLPAHHPLQLALPARDHPLPPRNRLDNKHQKSERGRKRELLLLLEAAPPDHLSRLPLHPDLLPRQQDLLGRPVHLDRLDLRPALLEPLAPLPLQKLSRVRR